MKRGEVWLVDLNPVRGSEMSKHRPILIVSRDDAGRLPLRVVVPFTSWQHHFTPLFWLVRIDPTPANGLTNSSAADTFQVRCISEERFVRRLGQLAGEDLRAVVEALALVVEA
jgi:mRNA interferase MazF